MVFTAPKFEDKIFYPSLGLIYDNSYVSKEDKLNMKI